MKTAQYIPGIMVGVYFLAIVLVYRRLSLVSLLMSAGVGAITHSVTGSLLYASAAALFVLFAMVAIIPREGFINVTMPLDSNVAADAQRILNSTYEPRGIKEGFVSSPPEISKRVMNMQTLGFNEGFINIAQNVAPTTDVVEGYEDVKNEKNEIPAPATLKAAVEAAKPKDAMMPFKLGEIPSQVKNGPHIDAGSTLMQAIKGLNPDQINAMTKDTQQLIETQKSLMGMLGTMKPMLNDGKQLMETFQQMFG